MCDTINYIFILVVLYLGEVNKTLSSENKNLDKEVISFYDVKKLIEKNRIDEAIEMLNKMFVLTGDLKCQFE